MTFKVDLFPKIAEIIVTNCTAVKRNSYNTMSCSEMIFHLPVKLNISASR